MWSWTSQKGSFSLSSSGLQKKSLFCWHLFVYFFHLASSVAFSSEAPEPQSPFCFSLPCLLAQDVNTALMRASYWGKTDTVQLLLGAGADKEAKDNVSVKETESYACTYDKNSNSWGLWWGEDLLGGLPSLRLPLFPTYMCAERICARAILLFLFLTSRISRSIRGFILDFFNCCLWIIFIGERAQIIYIFCYCRCHMKDSVLRISFLADIFTYFITFHWPFCFSWVRACVCLLLLNTHTERKNGLK